MAENAHEPRRSGVFSRSQASRPGARRAIVIGAGSFGSAIAVLFARAGVRTTLQTRTLEQAARLNESRQNREYLPGIDLPRALRIEPVTDGVGRADFVFLAVPSGALRDVVASLADSGLGRAAAVSLSKGLVPPDGALPAAVLRGHFGAHRTACIGGPVHAQEMVRRGAALVAASASERLALALAEIFTLSGVLCEISSDPAGVELAGVARNAAALAAGATESQGLGAAGAAAGHIFAEVWRYAKANGASPESMIGLAGVGDLVAATLASQSPNRRVGELLGQGVTAAEIERAVGEAAESLESVRLLARAIECAGFPAPVTGALSRLISAELPLEEWVALVRPALPVRAGRRRPSWWRRMRSRGVSGAPRAL
jgi:glycerol-3-phosphate dehydrogenase (NAD(P)+)